MPTVPTRPDGALTRPRTHRWLPLEPLRSASVRPLTIARLAELGGVCDRTAARYSVAGELPEHVADAVCCALGLHPGLVYGAAWWDLAEVAA